jgi:hypothetical protein
MFHGEHFSPQILILPAFYSLSPDVNILIFWPQACGYRVFGPEQKEEAAS